MRVKQGVRAFTGAFEEWYELGMKKNVKSSITLPPEERRLVEALRKKLKAKSKVDVVRQGLRLLKANTDRASLREAYRNASADMRKSLKSEMVELDHLVGEGID